MPKKHATIYDVADLAGVSIATVSRFMNGGVVGTKSRKKVEDAMSVLHYSGPVQNHVQTKELALVVSNLSNPYYTAVCTGAESEASRNGYALQLYCTDPLVTLDDQFFQQLMDRNPSGVILVGSAVENGPEDMILKHLRLLRERTPIVTIGPPIAGLDCINISSDLSVSVKKSLAYLASLGHRRIAFIGGSSMARSPSLRQKGFYDEIKRLGLETPQEQHSETGFSPQAGELCVTKLYSRPKSEWPTALIALNDLVALGALRQLQRLGLHVPQDVSVIGCDNQFFTPYLNPPLTTIDLHPEDHGQCAVAELIASQSGSNLSFSQIRECSLILRESCAPARADW